MRTKRIILVPSNAGLGASSAVGTYIYTLPKGVRYARLDLVYIDGSGAPIDISSDPTGDFGTAGGLLGDIELQTNSKTFRIHSACDLDHANTLNGTQYGRGALKTGAAATLRQPLPIWFREPWRKDINQADSMAFNCDPTWGINTFQIKITLAVAMPATATFYILAYVDDITPNPNKGGLQALKRVYRYYLPANGNAGDYTQIALNNIQTILMVNPTGGYIQKCTAKLGGLLLRDAVYQPDNVAAMIGEGLNPAVSQVAGHFGYDLVWDYDDPIQSALPAAGNLWMHLDFSAATTGIIRTLVETLGAPDV